MFQALIGSIASLAGSFVEGQGIQAKGESNSCTN